MANTRWRTEEYITSWQQFHHEVRLKDHKLLTRLGDFPNSVLITGCQRSGTTMLARIITQSDGMVKYWFGPDDELDAALILSGYVDHQPDGRYCFQTTFVNRAYYEYYVGGDQFKIVWVLRNPVSVTYSMLNNWSDSALEIPFELCGVPSLTGVDKQLYRLIGTRALSKLRRACYTYNGKVSQLFDLRRNFGPDRLIVVNYDELVVNKDVILPAIYNFVDLEYKPEYAERINSRSIGKKKQFSGGDIRTVNLMCGSVYQQARNLLSILANSQ